MADDATTTETQATEAKSAEANPDKGEADSGLGYQFRQAQKAAKAAEKKAQELEAQLKAIEEAKLSDLEKAQRKLQELETYKQKAEAYERVLTERFERQLEAIPEDARPKVDRFVPPDLPLERRLSLLEDLKAEGFFTPPAPAASSGPSRPQPHVDNSRPVNGTTPAGFISMGEMRDLALKDPDKFSRIRADVMAGRLTLKG